MNRVSALVFGVLAALAHVGCGAAYYEGTEPATANATVQTEVAAQTEITNEEVQIGATAQDDWYEDTDPTAVTEFRTTLDPYGTWVEDESYGTVWVPSATVVGADFAPYVSAGHWVYESDYVWVSDYDWGWAPFHYGRWVWISGRGWSWIPGRRYAGAWVTWRVGYDGYGYVGWAPLPPTWYWRGGIAYGLGWYPQASYVFCRHEHLFSPSVHGVIANGPMVQEIGSHTRPYTPAAPTVGGRTLAQPNVGAHSIGGPPPGQLGIQSAPRPPADNAGLLRAQQYGRPSIATSMGARPPMMSARGPDGMGRSSATIGSSTTPTVPHYNNSGPTYMPHPQQGPTYTQQMPQRIPNQVGQPQYGPQRIPNQVTPQQAQPLPRATPQYTPPTYHTQPSFSQPSFSQPHYTPQQAQPSFSQPQFRSSQPSFSQPSFSQPHMSQPSFSRPSPQMNAPVMRSSPSVGGGSFGGGGGGMRSASPSVRRR